MASILSQSAPSIIPAHSLQQQLQPQPQPPLKLQTHQHLSIPSPPIRPASGLASFSCIQQCSSMSSSFNGRGKQIAGAVWASVSGVSSLRPMVVMSKPVIQFIRGTDEQTVPDVALTRSRDGTNGVATFMFDQPSVFDSSRELGDITGLYLIDEEGVLQSVDVSAKFVNGKPAKIEARYIMRNNREWDRFMRFMERYAESNGLGFVKK